MNAKEFLKYLKTNKVFYAYVKYNEDDGGYIQQLKKEWINILKDVPDDAIFDVSINDNSIYLN